jgi:hypothetical protein
VSAPARFTQADITRALRAAEKAGLCIGRVRIAPDGSIELVAAEPEEAQNNNWFNGSPLWRDAG